MYYNKYFFFGCLTILFSECTGQTGNQTPSLPLKLDSLSKNTTPIVEKDSIQQTIMDTTQKIVLVEMPNDTTQKSKISKDSTQKGVNDDFSDAEVEAMMHGTTALPVNWREFGTFEQTIAFSKIAPLGKMSVFIVSTAWCGPCKSLKQSLLKINKKYEKSVQFYYINMSQGQNYEALRKTDAYFFARMYDRLKEWPRVTITSPTGSILKNFSQEDLVTECQKNKLFELYEAAAKMNRPIALTEVQTAIDPCTKLGVFEKVIEILERFAPHLSKFDAKKVIIEQPTPSKK